MYQHVMSLGVNVVHLDVSRHSVEGLANPEKVSRKDRPTFLLRADDSMHKINAEAVRNDFPEGLESELRRIQSNKLIWSLKDLTLELKANN